MVGACCEGVQGQVELVVPSEFKTGFTEEVIADLCGCVAFSEVGGMGGDSVGDDPLFNVFFVGESQVFLRCYVADHSGAIPGDECGADSGGDVVVARRNVRDQGSQSIERCFVAFFQFAGHVFADEVHGDVSGPFNHDLDVVFPGDSCEFAQGFEF